MRAYRATILLTALLAVLPLAVFGYSCGHDFDFHVLNWIEVAAHWRHGVLYPHWAASAAYGAGEPRFVFYPPLSWMLGALLGLLLPWSATPVAYTFLVLCGCGLSMYRLARDWAAPSAALLAAVVYAANPYLLFTAYERTAYAELMAAVWLPLLFRAILRPRVTVSGIAIPVALLWLTNAPAAVMGCYALAVLALVRLAIGCIALKGHGFSRAIPAAEEEASAPEGLNQVEQGTGSSARKIDRPDAPLQLAIKTAAGTALGLALAAIYIVPAAYERRWVQIKMAMVPGMRIQDSFLFGHTADPDHDRVLWTASWIALLLLAATVAAAMVALRRRLAAEPQKAPFSTRGPALALCVLAAILCFLQMPISLALWSHAPELAFLQFPWRWLAVLSVATALLLAFAVRDMHRWHLWRIGVVALPLILIPPAYAAFHQGCDAEDTIPVALQLFRLGAGTAPTDEYTPLAADNDVLKHSMPSAALTDSIDGPLSPAVGEVVVADRAAEHWRLSATSSHAQFLVLRLRDYPAWKVRVNGALLRSRPQRNDGLMVLPISAGASAIDVEYGATSDQRMGDAISAAALLVLLAMRQRRRRAGGGAGASAAG